MVAQDEACRKMAGVFRTTPCSLTELLVCIPPIHYRLRHLLRNIGTRISTLPRSHALLDLPTASRPITLPPHHSIPPPILPDVAEMKPSRLPTLTPHHPSLKDWSRQRVGFLPYSPLHGPSLSALNNPSTTKILITSTTFHIPHLHLGIFTIFHHNSLHISDYVLESSQQRCTISALLHALRRVPLDVNIISIFYTDKQLPNYITNTYSSPNLDLCTAVTNCFDDLLAKHDLFFPGFWFSKAWAGARTQDWQPQRKEEATMFTLHHLTPLPPSKDRIILEWRLNRATMKRSDPRQTYAVFHDEPSHSLHPFIIGVLSSKSRVLQSAAFQLATHHAFDATYSTQFRPSANDNTTCPHCHVPWTIPHVLFDCDAFWEARGLFLDPVYHNTIHTLFSCKNGGRRLVEFLHATQALLRPLPPRPTDPPWPGTL
jgi:hypothetical protein